ncbi:hypothetical protein Tco_0039902 [Tanacetum coccineum]
MDMAEKEAAERRCPASYTSREKHTGISANGATAARSLKSVCQGILLSSEGYSLSLLFPCITSFFTYIGGFMLTYIFLAENILHVFGIGFLNLGQRTPGANESAGTVALGSASTVLQSLGKC